MGPPGDAWGGPVGRRQRSGAREELHDEPESEDDQGGYLDDGSEDEHRDYGQDRRERIQKHVGPSTPAIAPLAPTVGMETLLFRTVWTSPAPTPAAR
jgi:hypothetical protein